MKYFNFEYKMVVISLFLFYFFLPYLRFMSLEHTNKVVPLAVSRITQPYETLNYMAVYGLLIVFIYSFLRLILPKRASSKGSQAPLKPLIFVQLVILMTCVIYTSLGVKVSFINVIMSNLATFVILTLGYLSAKLTYRFFVLTIAVLTTGRGLVAIYFFHHFLKSSWFKKLFILSLLFIFMIGLDIARNTGSFGYIVTLLYRMDINEFAWITYSFPFFDAVNGVETYVRINGPRNISEFYSNLWFHIPRVIYPEKPTLYGDEIALTKLIFGVDPKNATLAITGAGISRVYYAEYALLIGPLIDTISIIFSFVVVDILFKRFGSDATNILKIYILIKLMRNGQEYLFTSFLWLLVISLMLFIFMNALKNIHYKIS